MSLIFSEVRLCDVRSPCILQSFVNHGAVLHKVFVVGDDHFTVERPSLKNFPPGPCGQYGPPVGKRRSLLTFLFRTQPDLSDTMTMCPMTLTEQTDLWISCGSTVLCEGALHPETSVAHA